EGANTATPSFTAPSNGGAGGAQRLVFTVTVSDGALSATAQATVTVEHVNHAPVANAGTPPTVRPLSTVTLDGRRSPHPHPAGAPISLPCTQVGGRSVVLVNANPATPSFTTPVVPTTTPLTFRLTVTDAVLTSAPADVTVTVVNGAPACGAAQATPNLLWPP